jgi:2',3'-cyclic-nucleotide 2'-phosphodiesterase (5'-nucleotidase family)
MLAGGVFAASGDVTPIGSTTEVVIFHTNDTHSHMMPLDLEGFGENIGGMVRRQAFLRHWREIHPLSLTLDAGDFFQGTPFFAFFHGEAEMKAYAECGYDALTLGNHDLDKGLANLREKVAIAGIPLICSNVLASDGREIFPPFRIFDRGPVKIGVLGCLGREAWDVTAENLRQDLEFFEPVECLRPWVQRVRPQVDLLILLSHSGFEVDVELARSLPELDVIIGGHTNTHLESPYEVRRQPGVVSSVTPAGQKGTLIVQAYKWGLFVGVLRLFLDADKSIATFSGELVPMNDSIVVPPDSPIERLLEVYLAGMRHVTGTVVGRLTESMPYPDEEKHSRTLPLGTFISNAIREFAGADIALINSGGIRSGLAAGRVTMNDVYTCLPFDNTIVTLRMTGRDVLGMLKFIAGQYGEITGYQFAGIEFRLHRRSRRVSGVKINGVPINPDQEYLLATISYLADGAQHGAILFRHGRQKTDNGFCLRDIVLEAIRKTGTITPPAAQPMILQDD